VPLDFWLAPPVGRNWKFLWSNPGVPVWAVFILVLVFFIGVWALVLMTLTRYAKIHSWLLPVFAIGLGAPRWCQMFWSLTGVGHNLAWAGSFGPFLSVATWLWLGVLDAVQGVGLGMALLQTLSRFHGSSLAPSIVASNARLISLRARLLQSTRPSCSASASARSW